MITSIAKPEPRAREKARKKREDAAARRRCCDIVWRRANSRCEDCDVQVYRSHTFFRKVGHVDELIPRSQGGDPHDPDNCRLRCYDDHMAGPSGAHRVTPNWRSHLFVRKP